MPSRIDGASPTFGFLNFGTSGPFAEVYQGVAGNLTIDVLFMAGLAGVGLALLLGIGVRIAGYAGALMYAMIYFAHLLPEHHPFLDEHISGALIMIGLTMVPAGRTWGLGKWWARQKIVRRVPVLK